MDNSELIAVFVDEARLHLRTLETRVLQIETSETSDAPIDVDLIDDALRATHSLKGAACFLKLGDVVAVSHRVEDLMTEMRNGGQSVNAATVNIILAAVDRLGVMVDCVETGAETDATAICRRLDEHIKEITQCQARSFTQGPDTLRGSAAQPKTPAPKGHETVRRTPEVTSGEFNNDRVGDSIDRIQLQIDSVFAKQEPSPPPASLIRHSSESEASTNHARQPLGSIAPPAASVRVSIETLDRMGRAAEELIRNRDQLLHLLMKNADTTDLDAGQLPENADRGVLEPIIANLDRVSVELRDSIREARQQKIAQLLSRFPRFIRDLCVTLDKEILSEIDCDDIEADSLVVDAIADPLMHLVRNACDHGLEPPSERAAAGKSRAGTVSLRSYRREGKLIVEVTDDGRGIDPVVVKSRAVEKGVVTPGVADTLTDIEACNLIFLPGISTAPAVTEVSGRGVGMDVVKTNTEAIGGSIEVDTRIGRGTTIRMTLPAIGKTD
ncbi:chemotaxis protein CheA [Rhodopirellula sp. SWK7]|uniref:chemotaxis protein CheA n=1 Tax=Rhodopirellula sp. SWK7 TaxID=595460 RepID=UPI0002BDA1A2|nr:ATP-binding protein [Rhodopirellula sp. SWK7]EMI42062.1 chemotaxis protein CheA [Rhodopirellula sp. SWK7]